MEEGTKTKLELSQCSLEVWRAFPGVHYWAGCCRGGREPERGAAEMWGSSWSSEGPATAPIIHGIKLATPTSPQTGSNKIDNSQQAFYCYI